MNSKNNRSFSIIILFIVLTIIGACFLPLLNIKLTPTRSLPTIRVNYYWHNVSAGIIEKEVTSKLEGVLNSITGVKEIRSRSSQGYGYIEVSFAKYVDLDLARFEMSTLIRQIYPELPAGVSYPDISMKTENEDRKFLMSYTLNAATSPYLIHQIVEEHIVPGLSLVPGVSDIEVSGSVPFVWEVKYNSRELLQWGITLEMLVKSIRNYFSREELSGVVVSRDLGTSTSIIIETQDNDQLRACEIPVAKIRDRIIYLSNVAELTFREKEPESYFRINGLNTINMIFYADKTSNQIKVSNRLVTELNKLKADLPPGFSMIKTYDATEYIRKELEKITWRTGLSLFILLLFILIISRQWRYLWIIILSLVANLGVAAILYYLLKLEIHLYVMAGITVSLGIIMDNTIVMLDHIKHHKDKKAFLAILAATLTTVGSLSVIFFLSEEQKLKLIDFALVVIVNLLVSLLIAVLLLPAILQKYPLNNKISKGTFNIKRKVFRIGNLYKNIILFACRWRSAFFILAILGFGLPVHLMPDELEGEGKIQNLYNKTIGSFWYQEHLKQPLEKVLGGTLRLFSENVFQHSFFAEPEQTRLNIVGKMPEGSTLKQLNDAMMYMEDYLSHFNEIEQYQCEIYNAKNGRISVLFTDSAEYSSFPYILKNMVTEKAMNFGGMDWSVYGVGRVFSNAAGEGIRNSRIKLYGYNYANLNSYANDLIMRLLDNPRIKECELVGSSAWNTRVKYEYQFHANEELLALYDTDYFHIYNHMYEMLGNSVSDRVIIGGEEEELNYISDDYDIWQMNNVPLQIGKKRVKLSGFSQIEKESVGNDIYKKNQEYQLVVQYDYIGPVKLGNRVIEKHIDETRKILPLGYSVKKSGYYSWWDGKEKTSYWLLALVIIIIYLICSILLESFTQPLAVIAIIPISFIGLFLTFYLFDLNFDQGGYAALVLLCGISVNAALYIVNEWNNTRQGSHKNSLRNYLKAFHHKIVPILLTTISTILGFVPFLISAKDEIFWYSLAAGTIGGLLFALAGIIFYLPLFLRKNVVGELYC